MQDKTTEQFTARTEDIEGMLRNLCAYALSDPDPLQRYIDLTHQQVLFDGVIAAIKRERGKALADLLGIGVPLGKVAELAGLDSPARAKALITASGVAIPRPRRAGAKRTTPSRDAKPPAAAKAPPAAQQSRAAVPPSAAVPPREVAPSREAVPPSSAVPSREAVPSPGAAPSGRAVPKKRARAGAPMLPPEIVPTGKRVLTAEEKAALGLLPARAATMAGR